MLGQKLFVRDQLLLLWFLIHFSMEQSRKQLPHLHYDCLSLSLPSLSFFLPFLFVSALSNLHFII